MIKRLILTICFLLVCSQGFCDTFGQQSTSGSEDYTVSGIYQASKAFGTPSSNGTLNSISIYVKAEGAGSKILVAIYDDNAGAPGDLIAEASVEQSVLDGTFSWITVDVSCSLTASTQYWLAWRESSGSSNIVYVYTSESGEQKYDFDSAFPSTFPSGSNSDQRLAIYATYTPEGAVTRRVMIIQ